MYLLFTLNLSPSKPGYTSLSLFLGPFAPFQTLLVLIEAFSKYLEVKRDSIKEVFPVMERIFALQSVYRAVYTEYATVPLTKQHRGKRLETSPIQF